MSNANLALRGLTFIHVNNKGRVKRICPFLGSFSTRKKNADSKRTRNTDKKCFEENPTSKNKSSLLFHAQFDLNLYRYCQAFSQQALCYDAITISTTMNHVNLLF